MPPIVEVTDLRTHFSSDRGVVRAVDGVSFDIHEGETLGLVGESGCGKSVTALSIMRLVRWPPGRIVGGQVNFEGVDLLQLDDEAMRRVRGRKIAMVFQEPMTSLNPVLSIGTQIAEPIQLHLGYDRRSALARAAELLQMVGISEPRRRLSQYPHQFSGGMRQRVMIAMALSCNPRLIIADEATTALDVTIQAQVLEIMKRLTEQMGVALLLITHNLGIVARYADRVNVMYAGQIVEHGTADDVFLRPEMPYTRGLLRAVPQLRLRSEFLHTIEGQPPDLVAEMKACRFSPRCEHARVICLERPPDLKPRAHDHLARCFGTEEGGWIT